MDAFLELYVPTACNNEYRVLLTMTYNVKHCLKGEKTRYNGDSSNGYYVLFSEFVVHFQIEKFEHGP